MNSQKLTKEALSVIESYKNLSIGNCKILCPYFNNRRSGVRGALRVLIGKGTPQEIEEEAVLFALREKIDLKKLNEQDLKKFLVDHNLGIDCSGFVYHVLDAELKAQNKGGLKKYLKRPCIKNLIRKLISKLRPVENTGVATFNNDINTGEIKLSDIKPGDMIIMMNTGLKNDMHHILLVESILNEVKDLSKPRPNNKPRSNVAENLDSPKDSSVASRLLQNIFYTHSFQFTTDGQYNHGIKHGEIKIINPNKNILDQVWSEVETHNHAKMAKELKIKRIKN
ncbi:MAG: hypothetical protein ABIJ23_01590 [Candidatus Magasanikbacteria bacterium]